MMGLAAKGTSGHRPARRRSVARRCVLAACCAILVLLPAGAAGSAGAGTLPAGFSQQEVAGARLLFKAPATPGQGSIFAVMFAGSGDKGPDETHCAHAAEHMVFRNPLGDGRSLGQAITQWGGIYNGWSGTWHTQFEISVPDERLPEALQKLVEALFPASLDEGALREEIRQRLARELKHMTTNELSAPMNAFRQQLSRGTPYEERFFEVPVTDLTAAQVASFMAREYSPQRLVIVVVASIEEATLVEALADALARVPPGDPPARRQVSLSPPPSASLALRGLGTPLIMVGLGVDGVAEDEHDALLAVAFSMVLPQVLAAAPPGLEPHPHPGMSGPLPMEGACCLVATFTVTRGLPAAKLERLAEEAVEAVRSAVNAFTADGPDESAFLGLLEASGEPSCRSSCRRGSRPA